MKRLWQLKEKFKRDSIQIIKEEKDEGINILYLDKLPDSVKILNSGQRKRVYEYDSFIMKSCDPRKFTSDFLSDFEELKLEIKYSIKFRDKIDILQKIAIIRIDNYVFLVEELLLPYEKFSEGLLKRAIQKVEEAKKVFGNGDFKKENLVYDIENDYLLFTDVFPTKDHLITRDGIKIVEESEK